MPSSAVVLPFPFQGKKCASKCGLESEEEGKVNKLVGLCQITGKHTFYVHGSLVHISFALAFGSRFCDDFCSGILTKLGKCPHVKFPYD